MIRRGGAAYDDLWLEGEYLSYWSRDRLFWVPVSGGDEALVLDARDADGSTRVEGWLVRDDVVYWAKAGADPSQLELWQQSRDGGRPLLVSSITRDSLESVMLAQSPGALLVAGTTSAVVVPLDGGDVRPLAEVSDGALAGVDARGAYYSRAANRSRRGGRALEYELRLAPLDGSTPVRYWGRPAGHQLSRLWPLESGSLATGEYYIHDGRRHAVIAYLDADGEEQLVACDRADNALVGRPVFGARGLYAITRPANDRWRVVEIRLPE